MLNLCISLTSLLVNIFPDSIDITDFISKQLLISNPTHDFFNIDVAPFEMNLYFFLNVLFLFVEIIVELVNKLLTFLKTDYMPLSPRISLGFNHLSSLL